MIKRGNVSQNEAISMRPGHSAEAKIPFAWFQDVLSRIGAHSIQQLDELLPHRWATARL
jgi:hypothetical protein